MLTKRWNSRLRHIFVVSVSPPGTHIAPTVKPCLILTFSAEISCESMGLSDTVTVSAITFHGVMLTLSHCHVHTLTVFFSRITIAVSRYAMSFFWNLDLCVLDRMHVVDSVVFTISHHIHYIFGSKEDLSVTYQRRVNKSIGQVIHMALTVIFGSSGASPKT